MLDSETRRRIDNCRDILVGKLPDPKAQIEQITIGLIYKFMDDMDKEAVELGGKAKFFSDYKVPDPNHPEDRSKDIPVAFSNYAWDKLMAPKVTAVEMLTLYSEAIVGMEKNPNVPQLFRDIFKNAYLPYRDPETLKMFLKTIGEFEYTHSEKLGDAFEYLLSVMGSQGDAGQFRTPRHIIDFLVAIVDPDKHDTILDPACGTAGFLISAYKHILLKHTKANSQQYNIFSYNQLDEKPFNNLGDQLTPDDRKKLIQNLAGYDISPDMMRLSLVNLYLHGFPNPNIFEYDTLSSEDRWNESFDVVLANPPFMSPKGGIRPHKRFTISSNRSEVLFVDYIAEHLNPGGKAGIIVPEGIIFQSGKAYKALRKMLVEDYLYGVVSLPAGVFNPYSGVKTSILLLDKEIAKQRDEILFVKIDNDGYNLGAQRNPIKGGQLAEAIDLIHAYVKDGNVEASEMAHIVPKIEIAKGGDYNLSGERYRINETIHSKFPMELLREIAEINPVKSQIKNLRDDTKVSFVPMADLNEKQISFEPKEIRSLKEVFNGYTFFQDNDVLVAKVTPCFENGKAGLAKNLKNGIGFGSSEFLVLRATDRILSSFLYYLVSGDIFKDYAMPKMTGTGGLRRVPKDVVANFQIPLPPLSVQEAIVSEIEGYQKIIDGAKAVVENYKPVIDIDPEWEMVELGEVCEMEYGYTEKAKEVGDTRFIRITDIDTNGQLKNSNVKYIDLTEEARKSLLIKDDILVARTGATYGKTMIFNEEYPAVFASFLIRIKLRKNLVLPKYYWVFAQSEDYIKQAEKLMTGGGQPQFNANAIKKIILPLPELKVQEKIISQIEKEQALVNANKELITIFEQKIKDRIAKVWGAPAASDEVVLEELEDSFGMAAEAGEGYGGGS